MPVDRSNAGTARDRVRQARQEARRAVAADIAVVQLAADAAASDAADAQADATQALSDAAAAQVDADQALADAAAIDAAKVPKGPITASSLTIASNRFAGRVSASAGAIEEIGPAALTGDAPALTAVLAFWTAADALRKCTAADLPISTATQAAIDFLVGQVLITLPAVDAALAAAQEGLTLQAPGSFSLATTQFRVHGKRLTLTSSQRATLVGNARLLVA